MKVSAQKLCFRRMTPSNIISMPSRVTLLLLLSQCFYSAHPFLHQNSATPPRPFSFQANNSIGRQDLEGLKVPELKDRLRLMGLKVGGRKSELIDRILLSSSEGDGEGKQVLIEEEQLQKPEAHYATLPSDAVVILACKS